MASNTVNTAQISEKLMHARCRLMTREPWYGHIAMNISWIPSQMSWFKDEIQKTMGVRIVNNTVECVYYPPFVESLTIEELYAVIQHEIEHIVRCHCIRVGSRNPIAWNIAADMCVNGNKKSPRIGYKGTNNSEVIVPLAGNIFWIPDDWEQDGTTEQFYDKLLAAQPKTCGNCGRPINGGKNDDDKNDDDCGGGQGEDGGSGNGEKAEDNNCKCPTCGGSGNSTSFGGVSGNIIDDHSIWNQSDISPDEARQLIKDLVQEATEKNQGNAPGHLASAIEALSKPIVRWRELLRHYVGRHVGSHRITYSRRNRRHQRFGVPGVSHRAAGSVNIIIDTSGSIGKRELEQFFGEIESITSRMKVNILQWDAVFQGYSKYRRGDWRRFEVKGKGGTDMAAPYQWLADSRLVADVQIMLTDGYTGWAESVSFPVITVITTGEDKTQSPPYGHVVRMKL